MERTSVGVRNDLFLVLFQDHKKALTRGEEPCFNWGIIRSLLGGLSEDLIKQRSTTIVPIEATDGSPTPRAVLLFFSEALERQQIFEPVE
jgi:hypothetical protein